MNSTTAAALSIGPFACLFAACALRVIAAVQPEVAWTGERRNMLSVMSYALTGIAILGMVILMIVSGPIGFFGLLLSVFMFFVISELEVRIAGSRNRSNQVELIWLLALAVKSGRPLADEIEAFAQGTWGRRHRLLVEMAERLREGVPLTELAVPQGLLPRSAAMLISAGIESSTLEDSLRKSALRATLELSEDDESAIASGGLIYCAMIVPVTFLIVGFVMYYIRNSKRSLMTSVPSFLSPRFC